MIQVSAAPYRLLFLAVFLFIAATAQAQQRPPRAAIKDTSANLFADSIPPLVDSATGRVISRGRSPRKAALRSAIIPGWGQLYNGKLWKVPIVYAALGVTGSIFTYNLKWYNRTRYAYKVLLEEGASSYTKVNPKLQAFVQNDRRETLRYYRDSYRRDIDYSAVFFLIGWGLNVVDATVDAHLSTFDVSPDLTLRIKPGYSDMAGTNGLSLVLQFR